MPRVVSLTRAKVRFEASSLPAGSFSDSGKSKFCSIVRTKAVARLSDPFWLLGVNDISANSVLVADNPRNANLSHHS